MLSISNRIAINSMLGSSNGEVCRNFTTLDGTADYYTIPTVSLAGDFEIEVDFSSTDTGNMLLGQLGSSSPFIYHQTDTNIRINITVSHDFAFTNLSDGKLNKLKVVRASGIITVSVNGVDSIGGTVADTTTLTYDLIGAYSTPINFTNGIISDVKITDGTELIRYYKIDEDLSATSTIIDSGSDGSNGTAVSITASEEFCLVGPDWVSTTELWTHGNVSAVAAVSGFVGGVSVVAISGLVYRFNYDVANFVNGSTEAFITASGINRTSNGTYEDTLVATGVAAGWDVATNPTTLDVENGSIKRILQAP